MPRKAQRRTEWHKDASGRWCRSWGERGLRLRLFQKRTDGNFYAATWSNGTLRQVPIGTHDRDEAERQAKEILASLYQGKKAGPAVEDTPLTLVELWRRYSEECSEFRDNCDRSRLEAG